MTKRNGVPSQQEFEDDVRRGEEKLRTIAAHYAPVPTPPELEPLLLASKGMLSLLWHEGREPPIKLANSALRFTLKTILTALTEPGLRNFNVEALRRRNIEEAEALVAAGKQGIKRNAAQIANEQKMQDALALFKRAVTVLLKAAPESFFYRKFAHRGSEGKRVAALLQLTTWLLAECMRVEQRTFKEQFVAQSIAIPPAAYVAAIEGKAEKKKIANIRRARARAKPNAKDLAEIAETTRGKHFKRGRPKTKKRVHKL